MLKAFLVLTMMGVISVQAAAPSTATSRPDALAAALEKKLPELNIDGISFSDTVDFLRDVTGLNIVVDAVALKAGKVSEKTPVTMRLRDVRMRKALDLLMDQISTKEHKFVAQPIGEIIFITNGPRLQLKTEQFTTDGARVARDDPMKLKRRLPEVNFSQIALGDVVDFLRDITASNIFVQWRSLEAAGITKKTPITLKLRDVPFHQALRCVLDEAQSRGKGQALDFVASDGIIMIDQMTVTR